MITHLASQLHMPRMHHPIASTTVLWVNRNDHIYWLFPCVVKVRIQLLTELATVVIEDEAMLADGKGAGCDNVEGTCRVSGMVSGSKSQKRLGSRCLVLLVHGLHSIIHNCVSLVSLHGMACTG